MKTTTVKTETLQKLLDYIGPEEARDYEECIASEWGQEELKHHAYALILEIQNSINNQ
jgi:hypothetical protein